MRTVTLRGYLKEMSKSFTEEDAREEALFCLNVLQRAHGLMYQIAAVPAPTDRIAADAKLYQDLIRCMWWSVMHLQCLVFAIDSAIQASAEVKHEVLVGLRAAVMAYAAARESWGLRFDENQSKELDLPALDPEE